MSSNLAVRNRFMAQPLPPNRPTRVYLVDDSSSVRARLARTLAAMPSIAIAGEAASAGDAIRDILDTRPDVVLLDLNLEGRSGLEVLRAVREQAPAVIFIVLTNHAEPQYRRACARAGASHFFDKSNELERACAVIAEIARERSPS